MSVLFVITYMYRCIHVYEFVCIENKEIFYHVKYTTDPHLLKLGLNHHWESDMMHDNIHTNIQEYAFETIMSKMSTILFRLQCVHRVG